MIEIAVAATIMLAAGGYGYLADFERYSVFCVGLSRRVDRARVTGEHECIDCGETVDEAERVKWYRELVVFGAPIYTILDGEHYYGERHASAEYIFGDVPTVDDVPWFWSVLESFFGSVPEIEPETESNAFEGVTTGVSDVFAFLPALFLVMIAAAVIGLVGRLSK